VHCEQVDRAAIGVVCAGSLALQRQTTREGVHRRTLLSAVEVAQDRKGMSGPLDGRVGVAFECREARLTDPQHAEIRRLWGRAEQSLGALQLLAGVSDRRLA
jgi:hypothetical protein